MKDNVLEKLIQTFSAQRNIRIMEAFFLDHILGI